MIEAEEVLRAYRAAVHMSWEPWDEMAVKRKLFQIICASKGVEWEKEITPEIRKVLGLPEPQVYLRSSPCSRKSDRRRLQKEPEIRGYYRVGNDDFFRDQRTSVRRRTICAPLYYCMSCGGTSVGVYRP